MGGHLQPLKVAFSLQDGYRHRATTQQWRTYRLSLCAFGAFLIDMRLRICVYPLALRSAFSRLAYG